MTAPELDEQPERLTLATTLEVAEDRGADDDLRDLIAMALTDHEPAPEALPECPSCFTAMPCAVWTYAETESRAWLLERAQEAARSGRDTIERHAAARRLGRPATDLHAVRNDQPVAVPWVGDLR